MNKEGNLQNIIGEVLDITCEVSQLGNAEKSEKTKNKISNDCSNVLSGDALKEFNDKMLPVITQVLNEETAYPFEKELVRKILMKYMIDMLKYDPIVFSVQIFPLIIENLKGEDVDLFSPIKLIVDLIKEDNHVLNKLKDKRQLDVQNYIGNMKSLARESEIVRRILAITILKINDN